MSISIQLLGSPRVDIDGEDQGRPRGAKTWALLALLARSEGPLPRSRIAELLFSEADDPLGALRWTASQLRRLLDSADTVVGDPMELSLPADATVDVDLVLRGRWEDALDVPGLGRPLLEGVEPDAGASYELWLGGERRHLDGASAALLHEASSALLAREEADRAVTIAERLVGLDPYDENAEVMLIQALVAAGDHDAADERVRACTELFREELGVEPSPALAAAARSRPTPVTASPIMLQAQLEAGQAAMSAGAVDAGLVTLRGVAEGAGALGDDPLAVQALFALGVALVHTTRGTDEEAVTILHRARDLADAIGDDATSGGACRELGYVEMLRGRYDRAETWLEAGRERAAGNDAELGWIELVRGSCLSDTAHYAEGEQALHRAVELTARVGDPQGEAFAITHLCRLHFLRGELDKARETGRRAVELTETAGWTSFGPYPETWAALAELGHGCVDESHQLFEHAWAMACQIGDVCWQTLSLRGLGLVNAERDRTDESIDQLSEAPAHCRRLPDAYRWAEAYALEALVDVAVGAGDDRVGVWLGQLDTIAFRHGFREFQARAHLHRARLGEQDAWSLAAVLAAEIDNPLLARDVAALEPAGSL
jgi:DNA-binding SARP family transcriptional activator